MEQDTIVSIASQSAAKDQLSALLRARPGAPLAMAVDAKEQDLLDQYTDLCGISSHSGVERNGFAT
ncbi:MAG: hypothetical protein JSW48_01935 [Betaproteobacteria bacterium]|jgi:hypothetical protein|nr:MAG: hypothetical protein JSW48_01935 [Betaproteobacteria bacterium]